MLSTHWTMILIGCAGGLIPDALRIIKNRHDPKVPEYLRSRREAKQEFFEFLIYFFTVADGDDDYKELFFFDPV
jgi:hypothetical protein